MNLSLETAVNLEDIYIVISWKRSADLSNVERNLFIDSPLKAVSAGGHDRVT